MTIEELIDEKTKLEKLVIQLAGENQQLKDKLSAKRLVTLRSPICLKRGCTTKNVCKSQHI